MNLPFYIARRYLFPKKKHNVINITSAISACGVALATVTTVCTLSVFNDFQDTIADLFTMFDSELKVTIAEGKVFDAQDPRIQTIRQMPKVDMLTETLGENVMMQYKDHQTMAVIKGVQDNSEQLTVTDSILYGAGEFLLNDPAVDYGVTGVELVSTLGTGTRSVGPLQVYIPKRNGKVNLTNPVASFNMDYLYSPGVVFVVNQQKYDGQYILISSDFARRLLDYTTEVSTIELKLKSGSNISAVKGKIGKTPGDGFIIRNRYEQQKDVFRIMEIKKLISYLLLTFILVIACFNVIGSLSMLILDKKEDVNTLHKLGADDRLVSRISLFEGCMISFYGAIVGIMLGLVLCWVQTAYGIVSLGGGNAAGNFIVGSYPASVHLGDVIVIFTTVFTIGSLSAWYPVRYLSKRLLKM